MQCNKKFRLHFSRLSKSSTWSLFYKSRMEISQPFPFFYFMFYEYQINLWYFVASYFSCHPIGLMCTFCLLLVNFGLKIPVKQWLSIANTSTMPMFLLLGWEKTWVMFYFSRFCQERGWVLKQQELSQCSVGVPQCIQGSLGLSTGRCFELERPQIHGGSPWHDA